MKKINWGLLIMVIMILVMTIVGVYFMEEDWTEDMSALIWIIGMVCMTVIYVENVKSKTKVLKEKLNQIEKS